MAVKIVTDSTSDIPASIAQALGITVVPMTLLFGQESFRDRVDISIEEFYRRLTQEDIAPTTTQPPPGVFTNVCQQILHNGDAVLAIVISSKLSGLYSSIINAFDTITGKEHFYVIDSKLTSLSLGLVVIEAARMAQNGAGLAEISSTVNSLIAKSNTVMAFDTLKYLAKGGRIGKAQCLLGSLLPVKPVLILKDGEITPLTRLRSMTTVSDYLFNQIAGLKKVSALGVGHATTPDTAYALLNRLAVFFPKEQMIHSPISPVLGVYAGPNVLSISYIEE
ncbi:MAG: DegV family protein [Dehalococcoidia bacterium]|nr:DegV family protein [Dehalococcoidia bacterium]